MLPASGSMRRVLRAMGVWSTASDAHHLLPPGALARPRLAFSSVGQPLRHPVFDRLIDAGFRADKNDRSDKIGKKIRDAGPMKIPDLLVVGKKEAEESKVALRLRDGTDLGAMPLDDVLARMQAENDPFRGRTPRRRMSSK